MELSESEIERLSVFTGLDSTDFAESDRSATPRQFLRFQEGGDCVFFKVEEGRAVCSVYEARPKTCRKYPFTPSQDKVCEETWRKRLAEG